MEAIYEQIREFGSPPNQRELRKKIKEELDYADKETRKLLKKGESVFWEVEKGGKNSVVYIPKNSVWQFVRGYPKNCQTGG